MTDKNALLKILEPNGQEHILKFWDTLNEKQRDQLAQQIQEIDWPTVTRWAQDALKGESAPIPFDRLTPAPYHALVPETDDEKAFQAKAYAHGVELLKAGKVAAFTVAGGQGTRLGYDGPKGTYKVSPAMGKSLFQIFAESLQRNQEKYGCKFSWYIMTSKINDAETRAFFEANNYFGLEKSQVMMFTQATLPAFGMDGKALLAEKDSLALSPNGHGGSFAALRDSGALADMQKKGVTILSYWQVDNPLIKVMDPLFIGMHDLTQSDMSSRALIKRDYAEKLGHFCILDGKMIIVEYSDMPVELAKQEDKPGRLAYRAGSPAMHVLSVDFIDRITSGKLEFNPHRANKKVPYLDDNGNFVTPETPNAIKLEFFLFDALPLAKNPLVLEASREEQFAPVKNKEGEDSPASCRAAYLARGRKWLRAAGVVLPEGMEVELSTKSFVDEDDVKAFVKGGHLPPLKPNCINYVE
ncbi:MAG: UDPGP type 1 family protein [Lentisphaeria bacterium]|nr:UDPGP type 1 family protein [Lentisphaeria bacterium]